MIPRDRSSPGPPGVPERPSSLLICGRFAANIVAWQDRIEADGWIMAEREASPESNCDEPNQARTQAIIESAISGFQTGRAS